MKSINAVRMVEEFKKRKELLQFTNFPCSMAHFPFHRWSNQGIQGLATYLKNANANRQASRGTNSNLIQIFWPVLQWCILFCRRRSTRDRDYQLDLSIFGFSLCPTFPQLEVFCWHCLESARCGLAHLDQILDWTQFMLSI